MRFGRTFPIRNPTLGQPPAQGVYSAFNVLRADIIAGLTAATSQTNGWNNEVRDGTLQPHHVVRTSSTVVTITLPATPNHNITTQEEVTGNIPHEALVTTTGSDLVATPIFTIDPVTSLPAINKRKRSFDTLMRM